MTAVELYQSNAPALPERTGVPGSQDFDSWVAVVSDVIKLSNVICDTPFVPDGLRGSAPAVAAAMLAGREMGLGPMTSLANIDVIKGRPGPKPVLMRGMVLSRGHKWVDVDVSDIRAVVKGCRKGESEWTEVTFTAQQAKTAGIDLGKYPADKLYARASARLARRKFADVIMGMPYLAEEIEDGDVDGDAGVVLSSAIEAPKAADEPKPRTAQRRTRQAEPPKSGAENEKPAAPAAAADGARGAGPASSARSDDQPPLPGDEDDAPDQGGQQEEPAPDHDSPGTATVGPNGQLTALWASMQSDFEFTKDDKAQARGICEKIIGRKLEGGTTGNLSYNEARTVLDTLANWRATAESRGESPRAVMIAELAALGAAGEPDGGEPDAG